MKNKPQAFDQRQEMRRSDYEIAHKIDADLQYVSLHHHSFYEVNFLISGDVTYSIENRSYRIFPGDVIIISPKELHQVFIDVNSGPYERYTLWITPELLAQLSTKDTDLCSCFDINKPHYSNLLKLSHSQRNTMHTLLEETFQESGNSEFGADCFINALLISLMVLINRFSSTNAIQPDSETRMNALVSEIISYINLHYGEPLSLEILSEKFHVSKYHLCHEFSNRMEISIYKYLQKKRLLISRQMLSQGMKPTEVFSACGFNDYTGFYRAFCAEYGMSPRAFVQSNSPTQIFQ